MGQPALRAGARPVAPYYGAGPTQARHTASLHAVNCDAAARVPYPRRTRHRAATRTAKHMRDRHREPRRVHRHAEAV